MYQEGRTLQAFSLEGDLLKEVSIPGCGDLVGVFADEQSVYIADDDEHCIWRVWRAGNGGLVPSDKRASTTAPRQFIRPAGTPRESASPSLRNGASPSPRQGASPNQRPRASSSVTASVTSSVTSFGSSPRHAAAGSTSRGPPRGKPQGWGAQIAQVAQQIEVPDLDDL